MRTRAVILDVGNVLARDIWEPMFDHLALKYHLDKREVRKAGRLLWKTFAYVPARPANGARDMERRYWGLFRLIFRHRLRGKRVSIKSLIKLTDRYVIPVEGMRPILQALYARGTRLVICSNNNEIWWPRQAKKLHLKRYFSDNSLVLSSRIGAPKDRKEREMFRAAVAAARVPASACLFVDDRKENVKRAKSLRIDAVRFRNAAAFAAELQKRGLLDAQP